jgi:CheY-like chemotaxis protein
MHSTPTVLLAEDDDGHAILLKHSLKKAGFKDLVRRVTNGNAMLVLLEELPAEPDASFVVLLDINMPGLHERRCFYAYARTNGSRA